jgi:hypothetical protein
MKQNITLALDTHVLKRARGICRPALIEAVTAKVKAATICLGR